MKNYSFKGQNFFRLYSWKFSDLIRDKIQPAITNEDSKISVNLRRIMKKIKSIVEQLKYLQKWGRGVRGKVP